MKIELKKVYPAFLQAHGLPDDWEGGAFDKLFEENREVKKSLDEALGLTDNGRKRIASLGRSIVERFPNTLGFLQRVFEKNEKLSTALRSEDQLKANRLEDGQKFSRAMLKAVKVTDLERVGVGRSQFSKELPKLPTFMTIPKVKTKLVKTIPMGLS